ncbi:acyltransferase family protein [Pseudarthrobacter raffinosi]|uniref:acyltransferase family protein n=1 Tax=Pseudarthrobacter raffinosi TaxID=2953651 RepID=UPI0021136532|nr:acyltransferase [Pseudarthrobacter sp. MDT3-28]
MATIDEQTAAPSATSTPSHRVRSLDGLRGVAALVVVINHIMVTATTFADVANTSGRADTLSFEWWLSYTPLHLLWGGTEAVFIFFILSGYVLTGPTEKKSFSWSAYYPKRLVRLYLPVWGSLVLAGLSTLVVARHGVDGGSWWVNNHEPFNVKSATVSGLLLGPIDFLNNPLWSLSWEVWFSLLLPAYVVLCRRSAETLQRTVLFLALLVVTVAAGTLTDSKALRYLPMFAIGILLYMQREAISRWAATLDTKRWAWPAILCGSITLLTGYWMAQASPAIPEALVTLARSGQVIGAALVVIIALHWGPARTFLQLPAIGWLGARSFSLYLTHDAVVISTTFALGGTPPLWITALIAVPTSLLLAELFFRTVERPSHELSKRVGTARQGKAARRK